MKIAYVITRGDDLGGAQVHVRDLSEGLMARGHEVTVLAGGTGTFSADLAARGIPFRSIRHLGVPIDPKKDGLAFIGIVQALREIQPDLVSAHTAKAGFLGRIAGTILGLPVLFTPHGWSIGDRISRRKGTFFRQLERVASVVSSRIINVCEFELQLAKKHGIAPDRKLAVVHNGLADIAESSRADVTIDPPKLIMTARMAEPKDHATLLTALSGLKHLPWTLDFVGDGPLQESLRQLAVSNGIQDRVRFLGFRDDIPARLREAQIFVLTSRSEAFPYSILEAMRAGLPVVASCVGGIPEGVADGETGLLAEAGNVSNLKDHLARLIGNARLRKQLGEAGRQSFLANFTFDRMFVKTLRIYQEALTGEARTVAQPQAASSELQE